MTTALDEAVAAPQARARERQAKIVELEAEVTKWKQDYKDLALAVAKREGYTAEPVPAVKGDATFTITPPLPVTVLAAIEDTTAPFSQPRTAAIEAAKALLENGAQPEEVEAQLRKGEEIAV